MLKARQLSKITIIAKRTAFLHLNCKVQCWSNGVDTSGLCKIRTNDHRHNLSNIHNGLSDVPGMTVPDFCAVTIFTSSCLTWATSSLIWVSNSRFWSRSWWLRAWPDKQNAVRCLGNDCQQGASKLWPGGQQPLAEPIQWFCWRSTSTFRPIRV